jgi:hypothetical protein
MRAVRIRPGAWTSTGRNACGAKGRVAREDLDTNMLLLIEVSAWETVQRDIGLNII